MKAAATSPRGAAFASDPVPAFVGGRNRGAAAAHATLDLLPDIGGLAQNLGEARDWAGDEKDEEALLSLETVLAGAEDLLESLRKVSLKASNVLDNRKAVLA